MTIKKWIAFVLMAAASLTGCAIDAGTGEDGEEPIAEDESSLTRRDTCMMGCGNKYSLCVNGGKTVNACATDYNNCLAACDTLYPIAKPPPQP